MWFVVVLIRPTWNSTDGMLWDYCAKPRGYPRVRFTNNCKIFTFYFQLKFKTCDWLGKSRFELAHTKKNSTFWRIGQNNWQTSFMASVVCFSVFCLVSVHVWKILCVCNDAYRSDRSPKEFSNSSFVEGLANLASKNKLTIFLNFTAPYHGKWTHDAEGAVVKRKYLNGIAQGAIDWTEFRSQSPADFLSQAIVQYLNEEFTKENNTKSIFRFAHLLPSADIRLALSAVKTIPDFKKHYQYKIISRQELYYRHLSCHCSHCLNAEGNECINKDFVGTWKPIKFKRKTQSQIQKKK